MQSVCQARAQGAVVLGKAVSTELANIHPAGTCNPRNLNHTPGGSSSGSAAAVADYMVPLAFGTQTGGSLIRPASYCAIVGYKPTFDFISTAGVKALSASLDTVGVYGRTVPDAALIGRALIGFDYPGARADREGRCRRRPRLHAGIPDKQLCDVVIHLKDGGAVCGRREIMKGEPGNPHPPEEVEKEFYDLTVPVWGGKRANDLYSALPRLEDVADLRAFGRALPCSSVGFWCNNFADVARQWIRRFIRTCHITPTQDSKPPASIAGLRILRHYYDQNGSILQASLGYCPEGRFSYHTRMRVNHHQGRD